LIVVPHYEQLSVRNSFYEVLKEYPTLHQYFPVYSAAYIPGRRYFWEIFATLHYDDAMKFIDEERTNRYKREEEENNRIIKIDPTIYNEIMNCKYFSKKKGRALYAQKNSDKDDAPPNATTGTKVIKPVGKKFNEGNSAGKQLVFSGMKRKRDEETAGDIIDMQADTKYDNSGQKFQTPSNKVRNSFSRKDNSIVLSAAR